MVKVNHIFYLFTYDVLDELLTKVVFVFDCLDKVNFIQNTLLDFWEFIFEVSVVNKASEPQIQHICIQHRLISNQNFDTVQLVNKLFSKIHFKIIANYLFF